MLISMPFAIIHPCTYTPKARWVTRADGTATCEMGDYFAEGFTHSGKPDGIRAKVGGYHRTLSTYLNALVDVGFSLDRTAEPAASGDVAERVAPPFRYVPAAFIARCTVSGGSVQ